MNVRVPANIAWFPADRTEVRITVFMKEAAESRTYGSVHPQSSTGEITHLTLPDKRQL